MDRQTNSLLRFGVFALTFAGGIIGFLAIVGIGGLVLPVLLGSIVGVGMLVLFCWGGTRLLGHLMLGNDPEYQEWCRRSDPWFDTLPPPFRAPPNVPPIAPYYCLRCGGDMWQPVGVCPNCGYGCDMMICSCGTQVREPKPGCFTTTGVICPVCGNVLRSS